MVPQTDLKWAVNGHGERLRHQEQDNTLEVSSENVARNGMVWFPSKMNQQSPKLIVKQIRGSKPPFVSARVCDKRSQWRFGQRPLRHEEGGVISRKELVGLPRSHCPSTNPLPARLTFCGRASKMTMRRVPASVHICTHTSLFSLFSHSFQKQGKFKAGPSPRVFARFILFCATTARGENPKTAFLPRLPRPPRLPPPTAAPLQAYSVRTSSYMEFPLSTISTEFWNLGGFLFSGDSSRHTQCLSMAVVEHRLLTARARAVTKENQKKVCIRFVPNPARRVAGAHAGVACWRHPKTFSDSQRLVELCVF